MIKLNNTEQNVLLVAIDHIEEHLNELVQEYPEGKRDVLHERITSCDSIRTKIKQLCQYIEM